MKKILVLLIVIVTLCPIFSVNLYADETYPIIWLDEYYSQINPFFEDLASVSKTIDNKTKWGYIDKSGKEVIPLIYDHVGFFSEGLAAVYQDNKYGFINKNGEVVVLLVYDFVSQFREGFARVSKDEKFGFVDKMGKLVVPCVYDYADEYMVGGYTTVAKGKFLPKYGYINNKGEEVVPLIYDGAWGGFHEGLALVQKNRICGFVSTSGKVVIPLKYSGAGIFVDGLTYVAYNNKYGVIDKTGKMVTPMMYENIENFSNGLAKVIISGKEGKYGYVDKKGKLVINYKSSAYWGSSFYGGFAFLGKGENQYGYMDTTGKIVVPLKYGQTSPNEFSNGFAVVTVNKANQKFGYVDTKGKEITPLTYDIAHQFNDGMALVGKSVANSAWPNMGYIDKTGKEVVPANLDYAEDFSDGAAIISKDNKWGIIIASQLSTSKDKKSAAPTSSKTTVNGKEISFEAYNIAGNNYFKLRDIAMALNGSEKLFNVAWDGSKNAIAITTGKAYIPAGGELKVSEKLTPKDAIPTTSNIYINGVEVKLQAYSIEGYNYFKLRDLGKAINFNVEWGGSTNSIIIDSASVYKDL